MPRGPKLLGAITFLGIISKSLFDIVKIISKIMCVCIVCINKCHVILSQYHNRWVSVWVTMLVNNVLLNYYLQISSHSTLCLRTWEGPIAPVSPGAPKSSVRPWSTCSAIAKHSKSKATAKLLNICTEHALNTLFSLVQSCSVILSIVQSSLKEVKNVQWTRLNFFCCKKMFSRFATSLNIVQLAQAHCNQTGNSTAFNFGATM